MKYLVKSFVVTLLLIVCTYVHAEQTIAIIDMKFVLNNSKAGKGAQDYLQKTFKDNQKKFSDRENALKKEEGDLIAKQNILSKEDYKKKADKLRQEVTKYQNDRRESLEKITKQRADAKQELLKKIEPILDSYIKENNVSVVIDKKYTLGGQTNKDITNIIVEKLNKELPSLNLK